MVRSILARGILLVAALMYGGMMVLETVNVVGRYFFNKPIWGVYELNQILMASVVFLTWWYTHRRGLHIRIDLLARYMEKGTRDFCTRVGQVLTAMLFLLISFSSSRLCFSYWEQGRTLKHLDVPFAPFFLLLPLGSFLMLLEVIKEILSPGEGDAS